MSRLLQLYPKPWRDRYGDELDALLGASPPVFRDRIDVVRGAIDARLHPELVVVPGAPRVRPYVAVRRLGAATIVGAPLWILTWWLAATGPVVEDVNGSYVDGSAAMLPLLVSMSLLATSLAVHVVRLSGPAVAARVGGTVATAMLLLWAMGPWVWPLLVLGIVGLVVFAIGAWRIGAWSGSASAVLIAVASGSLAFIVAGIAIHLTAGAPQVVSALAGVGIGLATVAWVAVGAVHLGAVEPDPGPESPVPT